ncbi:MAG: hypothetical protein JSS81_00510 [Acidobacteria bacterium]|nr:hypothetical protein [Acidobacteriota bacterium]
MANLYFCVKIIEQELSVVDRPLSEQALRRLPEPSVKSEESARKSNVAEALSDVAGTFSVD